MPKGFKAEEIPTVAKFVYNSYVRDGADFTNFSNAVFTPAHKVEFLAKIDEVDGLTGLLTYWAQMGRISKDLYSSVEMLRPLINKLEGYVTLAKNNLSIDAKKFGFTELRREMKRKNVEGVADKIDLLMTNISDGHNEAELTAKGYKPALKTEILALRNTITGLNEQQQLKRTEVNEAIKQNWGVIEELWDMTLEVMAAGKAMYRVENKERVKDYTPNQLKKRVNQERKRNEEPEVEMGILAIKITNKGNDEPMEDVEFEVVETGDKDTTDEQGEGSMDLKVGTYSVKVKMAGFKEVLIKNVIVKKDETTDVGVSLEAEAGG